MTATATRPGPSAERPPDDPETPDIETSSAGYATRFAGPVGAWLLLARGYAVTVFGSAPRCADRIRRLLDGARCRFEAGDLLALPFPPRAFDIVVGYRLLPHVAHRQRLVAELCRVAGRAVLVDFPTVASLDVFSPRLFGMKMHLEGNTRPRTRFREAKVREAFAGQGFRMVGRRAEFALPMVLDRALRSPALSGSAEALCRRLGLTHRWGSPVIVRMERSSRTCTRARRSSRPTSPRTRRCSARRWRCWSRRAPRCLPTGAFAAQVASASSAGCPAAASPVRRTTSASVTAISRRTA